MFLCILSKIFELINLQARATKRHISGHTLALRPWSYKKKLAISPGLLPRLYGITTAHFSENKKRRQKGWSYNDDTILYSLWVLNFA